jgi:Kef-type K+ transport system membrane component KefB
MILRNPTEVFLVSLLIIFLLPYLFWKFFKTDNYMPLAVVQIVSGIILGPGVLGKQFPEFYNTIFTEDNIKVLSGIAWWGVMLFVWTAGVELNLKEAITKKKDTLVTSVFALLTPLFFGSILALIISNYPGWKGSDASTWQFTFGIGMATAVTALPILILLMEKLGIFNKELGKRTLRYASLDDIFIWAVLAIIIMDWQRVIRQIIFLPIFILFSYLLNKLIAKVSEPRDRWSIAMLWIILVGFAADWSGLHYMVGAFLAGVTMKPEWFNKNEMQIFRNNILLILMPVFFLITGLKTGWSVSGTLVIFVAIILLIVQFMSKVLGVLVAGKILKWKKTDAFIIGVLLQTKALIEIIFCTVLLDKGIITSQMFTALLIMAILSTTSTMPITRRLIKK